MYMGCAGGYPGSSQDTTGHVRPGTLQWVSQAMYMEYPGISRSLQEAVGCVRPGTWQWGVQAMYAGCPGTCSGMLKPCTLAVL